MHFYIFIAIEIVLFIVLIYCFYMLKYYRGKLERNKQVYEFRKYVLDNYYQYYNELPSYDEMMKDKKDVTIRNYLPQLTNYL